MGRTLGVELAHRLRLHGVEQVFGIPGVHNVELYRGLETSGLRHVLARHEQGVGFMADGYARATGKPGVGLVISGPGLTNIMTPMGQAYSDRVPLLIISSCLDETQARRGQLHQMRDQCGAAATVCAWSAEAKTPRAALRLVDRAFAQFAQGLSRPIHIQIPISVLAAPAAEIALPEPALHPAALPEGLAGICARIIAARRALFIFGAGAQGASTLAQKVLAQLGAAAFTTYTGRGVIAANTPLLFGATLARPSAGRVIASADLVVAIGTELAEVDLWRAELGHTGALIRVDTDPEVLADGQAGQIALRCDAGAFLGALSAECESGERGAAGGWCAAEVAQARAGWRAELDAQTQGVVPVVEALRAAMPARAMIYSDMTQLAYLAKEIWDMARPGHWHHPCGFGTLGYALPAAIGGKVARGAAPVVAIAGDYGFQYTVQELATLAEIGGSLPVILWDNAKLKEIEDCMVNAQITPHAVTALNPDFAALAAAYGLGFEQPETLAEIGPALARAFTSDKACIIRLTPDISH